MLDQITLAPELPSPGQTLSATSYQTGFGGKGSNQAVMAARLGAQVTMVVKLGRDAIGEQTQQHYAEEGIHTEFVYMDPDLPSGVAPIWVNERTGQNSILIVPGANMALTPSEVLQAASAIESAHVLLCQMEIPMECNLEALRIARKSTGVLTMLNPAPSGPVSDEILHLTNLLVPNESEAAALSGLPVTNVEEAERAARALQARGAQTVLITLGSEGALAVTQENELIRVFSPPVKAVDTTGAGDCFIGSLAFFLGAGVDLRTAMERACVIASWGVTKLGTQTSYLRREDLPAELFV